MTRKEEAVKFFLEHEEEIFQMTNLDADQGEVAFEDVLTSIRKKYFPNSTMASLGMYGMEKSATSERIKRQ